jgi:hypothetical protein
MSRYILIFTIGLLGLTHHAGAQEEATFTLEVSSDSVLLGNSLAVRFTLKNADGNDFTPPAFEGFEVNGPNVSSSMSIVNGEVSQQLSYTYYLKPLEAGNYYIEPASISAGKEVLETAPFEVIALPNPDGIVTEPELDGSQFKFHFDPKDLLSPKDLKKEKKKKKRKTYKM